MVTIMMAFGYVAMDVMLGLILNVHMCQDTIFQRVIFVRNVCEGVLVVVVT